MTTKFLIPVLAAIFAIGMSFTTPNYNSDPDLDYIPTENGLIVVEEVNCEVGNKLCKMEFVSGGTQYQIYDDPALNIEKRGSGKVIRY